MDLLPRPLGRGEETKTQWALAPLRRHIDEENYSYSISTGSFHFLRQEAIYV